MNETFEARKTKFLRPGRSSLLPPVSGPVAESLFRTQLKTRYTEIPNRRLLHPGSIKICPLNFLKLSHEVLQYNSKVKFFRLNLYVEKLFINVSGRVSCHDNTHDPYVGQVSLRREFTEGSTLLPLCSPGWFGRFATEDPARGRGLFEGGSCSWDHPQSVCRHNGSTLSGQSFYLGCPSLLFYPRSPSFIGPHKPFTVLGNTRLDPVITPPLPTKENEDKPRTKVLSRPVPSILRSRSLRDLVVVPSGHS